MSSYNDGYKIGYQDGYYFGKQMKTAITDINYLEGYQNGFSQGRTVGGYERPLYSKKKGTTVHMSV